MSQASLTLAHTVTLCTLYVRTECGNIDEYRAEGYTNHIRDVIGSEYRSQEHVKSKEFLPIAVSATSGNRA